jgi:hypothetical protein
MSASQGAMYVLHIASCQNVDRQIACIKIKTPPGT